MDKICNTLSQREKEVLRWLIDGKSNEEIGLIIAISPHTVKNHLRNIFKKLNVCNRQRAIAVALNKRIEE